MGFVTVHDELLGVWRHKHKVLKGAAVFPDVHVRVAAAEPGDGILVAGLGENMLVDGAVGFGQHIQPTYEVISHGVC